MQILVAMGITALVLLGISKMWMRLGSVVLLPLEWNSTVLLWGLGISAIVTLTSGLLYRFWPAYRDSADFYLNLVLKPLAWPDLIWLGLLPGMSEELLFRGVMLPAIGLNPIGLVISSLCFGALHLSGKNQWPYVVWATIVGLMLGFSATDHRKFTRADRRSHYYQFGIRLSLENARTGESLTRTGYFDLKSSFSTYLLDV